MSKYHVLRDELLAAHPVTGAYNADDQLAADQLNAINITVQRTTLTSAELFEAIDLTEYAALAIAEPAKHARVDRVLDLSGDIQVHPGSKARAFLTDAFPNGTTTFTEIGTVVSDTVSRGSQLGFDTVWPSEVAYARTL